MLTSPTTTQQTAYPARVRGAWLRALMHLEAIRRAPGKWLTALKWRLQGKRVRAQAQFAPLLAASPRAYPLWLLNEPLPVTILGKDLAPLVALVAAGSGQTDTVRSMQDQDVSVIALGTPGAVTLEEAAERIDWTRKPWVMPLYAGDVLAPSAVAAYRTTAASSHSDIVYADDDLINGQGERTKPHFKPAWNAELLRHFDYLTGACIVQARRDDLEGLPATDWVSNLVARVVERSTGAGVHVPHVLHHRCSRPNPVLVPVAGRPEDPLPKVTVIVPTRNRVDFLRACMDGIARTSYPDIEVIVVDNGSDERATLDYLAELGLASRTVLRDDGEFNFSRLNNRAARIAKGDLLCLLNNDIEVLFPDWLEVMVRQALRPEVGAVGAQLLYPDGRIQHAGVVLGICGGAAHAHRLLHPDEEGYFQRHALPQFVSAVTAACLVVRREIFEAVGGLNEADFAVAFNDVDLCMRLNEKGWQSLYEPRARLIHHESVSRGLDRDPVGAARFAKELGRLKALWGTAAGPEGNADPWHHPQLSRFSEQFVMRV